MTTSQSVHPPCGTLLPNLIRHYCRDASCGVCVRYACRRRGRAFFRRCDAAGQGDSPNSYVAFIAPLDGTIPFTRLRRRLHDAIDFRRGNDRHWKPFGMIGRWDGQSVRGVARLGNLGTADFHDLIGACEIAPLEMFESATVAQTLAAGPFMPLPGSLKTVFITINPKTRRHGNHVRGAGRYHGEPIPIVF